MARSKKPTYQELAKQVEELTAERNLLDLALHCTNVEDVDAREFTKRDEYGARYELRLYRSAGPHGGILVQIFSSPGQKDQVSARYFPDVVNDRKMNGDSYTSYYGRYLYPALDKLITFQVQRVSARA